MTHAAFEITEFKAVEDGDQPSGLFAARVSTYGNVDRNGDRMVKGAFKRTIKEWIASGSDIPVVYSHEHKDPDAFIGSVDPANITDTEDGLIVAGKFDIEHSPKARTVFNLLKKGLLKQWSFAYAVKGERMAKDKARELLDVDLFEVGPTLIGANANALTLAVKEMGEDEVILAELGGVTVDDSKGTLTIDTSVLPSGHYNVTKDGITEQTASSAPSDLKMDPSVAKALAEFDTQMDELIEAKVGRALSAKTEARVRAALEAISGILADIGNDTEETEEAAAVPATKEEAPKPETDGLHQQLSDAAMFLSLRGGN